MKIIKMISALLMLIMTEAILACPSCMGSMDDPKSGNLVYILGGFIILTYIPFYLIYKTIIKNKNFNQQVDDGQSE